MPHVDEGILHAYLDGALDALHEGGALPDAMTPADVISHLDACADCRARLNIERDIREQAGMVLRAATPVVHAPPIESLRTTRRAPAWVPYAWAASLMMAVGAGWWGSQLARDEMSESARGPVAEEAAPADAMNAQVSAPPASAPPQLNRTVQPPPPQPVLSEAGRGATAADMQSEIAANTAQKTTSGSATIGSAEAARSRPDSIVGQVLAVTPMQQPTQQAAADATARAQGAQALAQRAPPVVAAAPPPPPPSASRAVDPSVARFLNALRTINAAALPWRAVEPADTIRTFGIDGAARTQIETARAPDLGDVVRVRQRLPDGRDVELVQWSPQVTTLERREREQSRMAAAANQVVDTRRLEDDTHQLMVRTADGSTLVAILVKGTDFQSLPQRLIPIQRR